MPNELRHAKSAKGAARRQLIPHSPFLIPRFGFTLIELMVSIAIIVVLMVGVAKVFQFTSQAVSANQQLSSMIRDDRAAQATLKKDFDSYAADGPFIHFRSRVRTAYRNQQDEANDRDGDVNTYDFALNGTESLIPPALLNQRNHRVDVLSFFARGLFQRQTGNDGTFVAPMSSSDALIWYGHLILPNNGEYGPSATSSNQQYRNPFNYNPSGSPVNQPPFTRIDNPNNYYATQWMLGRAQILLVDPQPPVAGWPDGVIYDRNNVPQHFVFRNFAPTPAAYSVLSPLTVGSSATTNYGPDQFQRCRYDLAGTSITSFRKTLSDFIGENWSSATTYQSSSNNKARYADPSLPLSDRPLSYKANSNSTGGNPPPTNGAWQLDEDWWSRLMNFNRFNCNPFVIRPLTAATYSQQVPVFMQNCTQFIVEYAGDFLKQETDPTSNAYGRVLDVYDRPGGSTDGEVDFLVTFNDRTPFNGLIDTVERQSVRREIRWYGLPRDAKGTNSIPGYSKGTARYRYQNDLYNVVPLRDVVRTMESGGIAPPAGWLPGDSYENYPGAPFERFWYTSDPSTVRGAAISPTNPTLRQLQEYFGTGVNNMTAEEFYACAWGPHDTVRPSMIRIIITLDDPQGRLQEGQTFEYVFKLQK